MHVYVLVRYLYWLYVYIYVQMQIGVGKENKMDCIAEESIEYDDDGRSYFVDAEEYNEDSHLVCVRVHMCVPTYVCTYVCM